MNSMFEWHEQYLTSEHSEHVRYCSCHEKISDHFPKISEDFPKLFWRPDERSRTFSENFRKFPKMSEDFRRLLRKTRRCFNDTPTNLSTIKVTNLISVKSSISSHVRISYRFYQFVTTRYTTDFYIINAHLTLSHYTQLALTCIWKQRIIEGVCLHLKQSCMISG